MGGLDRVMVSDADEKSPVLFLEKSLKFELKSLKIRSLCSWITRYVSWLPKDQRDVPINKFQGQRIGRVPQAKWIRKRRRSRPKVQIEIDWLKYQNSIKDI